ncbi:MAG: LptF/LptG family permease [Planctomycetota bacterium]|nr:LptF/LptG family permease [Planctomycetota bacterium]
MPWILFRHFLAELTKVLLLTTVIIVVVVAFGAVIKPLTGNLLGPGGILKYIFLAMVPMLQYALPFSAGFAATIVTHRFASDNEVQAMSVSGISYFVILLPQAFLGIVLTIFMFFLVQTAIPRFLGLMSDVITNDAAQVFVSTIRSGESFRAGNFMIFADRIAMDDSVTDPSMQRIRMEGVAAIEIDAAGKLGTEFVARSGSADLYTEQSDLIVKVAFRDATILRPGESTVAFMSLVEPMPTLIDVGWERSPKYLPWSELLGVVGDPSKGAMVVIERMRLKKAIAPALAIEQLGAELAKSGSALLIGSESNRVYEIHDAILGGNGLIPLPPAKRFTVIEFNGQKALREASTVSAGLTGTANSDGATATSLLDLVLTEPRTRALHGEADRVVRWPPRIVGLSPDIKLEKNSSTLSVKELMEAARRIAAQTTPPLNAYASVAKGLIASIENKKSETFYEALSHVWMRFAQPMSVLFMLVLGGILAIWRRHSLPLTIFLLAFVPAIANVLLIASGQSILRSSKVGFGLTVMWLGNAVLLALILSIGRRMARR